MRFEWNDTENDNRKVAHGTLSSGSEVVPWKIDADSYSVDICFWTCDGIQTITINYGNLESDVQMARDMISVIRAGIRKAEDRAENG